MATVTQTPLTQEQFAQLPGDGARHEMDAGTLITLPPAKSLHTLIALTVLEALQNYLKAFAKARALPEAGYVLSQEPLTIRQPDVSVLSKDRIAATDADSYFQGAPDLAVEIVSPSDSAQDLESKVKQYLQGGAKQVWVLYPKTRNIHVFSGAQSPRILDANQTLEGGELLPGFSVKVADLFAV
jgi:Uma2 family endonuclease